MNKNGIYIIVIAILLGCTVFLACDKFISKDNSTDDSINNANNTNIVTNNTSSNKILDKFVGKYVSSEYDESKLDELDKYAYLEIKEDGTAEFRKVFKSGSGAFGEGKIAVSDNKIYLFNDKCIKPEIVGSECVFIGCLNVIEFDYNGDTLVANHYNIELKKQ